MTEQEIQISDNGLIDIATCLNRKRGPYQNKQMTWGDFVRRVAQAQRTSETYKQYISAQRDVQDDIKDCGGYVFGFLINGKRNKRSVMHRQALTLDVDNAPVDFWVEFTMLYGNAATMYSTHKHSPEAPRLRLVLPLDREVTPEEYQAISRRIAGNLGIDYFDNTTFEPERLMYWPSCSKDAEFLFEYQNGPRICADDVLKTYRDWHNINEWPISEKHRADFDSGIKREAKKQGDPLSKPGFVGAFCNAYSIEDAIQTFLADEYTETDVPGRYTYAKGSTTGGVITYDSKFSYSHHNTDPAGGRLCNAFDLVRVHLFGDKDSETPASTGAKKMPSFIAMCELLSNDERVKLELARYAFDEFEQFEGVKNDDAENDPMGLPDDTASAADWVKRLEVDQKGNIKPSITNTVLIIENDPPIKKCFAYDEFAQRERIVNPLPWYSKGEYVTDSDVANLMHYLQGKRGVTVAKPTLEAALRVIFTRKRFNPVRDYLKGLKWDGVPRISTLLADYLGAESSDYVKAVTRKTLIAAVARVLNPGCKFDYVLTLVGKQGIGKSTLIKKLGAAWFTDSLSFSMLHSKEANEQLQGFWIIEIAELSGIRKTDVEVIKSFVARPVDSYRVPYSVRPEQFPRQCIFIGTTNTMAFLRDPSGNRRFWPVLLYVNTPKMAVQEIDTNTVGQIWAEAVAYYEQGENLFLSDSLEAVARTVQERHTEEDDRAGLMLEFINTEVPGNWDDRPLCDRHNYFAGVGFDIETDVKKKKREQVCAAEIWCECFRRSQSDMTNQNTKFIHDFLQNLPGWVKSKSTRKFSLYGYQRAYYKTM